MAWPALRRIPVRSACRRSKLRPLAAPPRQPAQRRLRETYESSLTTPQSAIKILAAHHIQQTASHRGRTATERQEIALLSRAVVDVAITTSAADDEAARALLRVLGMPFADKEVSD